MVHVHLQLDLPENLVLHVRLLNLRLVHHFQREDRAGILLLRQVDVPEAAAAQLLPQLKLVYAHPLLRHRLGLLLHADLFEES